MKAKFTSLVVLLLFTGSLGLAASDIDIGALPAAVRNTLNASADGVALKQITVHNLNGETVYDIELDKKGGTNPWLHITKEGRLLSDSATRTDAVNTPPVYPGVVTPNVVTRLSLNDLPAAAQQTAKKETAGREIATIEREEWNGQPGYRVTLREAGRNPEFYVAEDGSLIEPKEKPPGVETLFVGTRFQDTPTDVQQTIRHQVGSGEIVKISKETDRGEPATYNVEIKDEHGAYQIRVSENGRILENTRPTEHPADRG